MILIPGQRLLVRLESEFHQNFQSMKFWSLRLDQLSVNISMAKAKPKQILYASAGQGTITHLAVERKVSASTQNQAFNALLVKGEIKPIANPARVRSPKLPDVPTPFEFAKTEEDKQVLALFYSQQTVARPVLSPPGLPADRLAALRAGFMAMGDLQQAVF